MRILNRTVGRIAAGFLAVILLSSCMLFQQHVVLDNFILVRTQPEDTIESLAQEYLHTPSQAWEISEFNRIENITAGEDVIIPLEPFKKGGVTPWGIQTVPIIAYAGFSESKSGKYMVTAAAFEKQLKYLGDNGYHVISLTEFYDFLDYRQQIPAKSIVITIDSSMSSVVTIAYPLLQKYGYSATIFVYTASIGNENALSWGDLEKMRQSGHQIESHSCRRRNLAIRNKEESFKTYFQVLDEEINDSKEAIREHLGLESNYFAYPYGETNGLVIEILKKKGYRGAVTYQRGSNPFYSDPFHVRRSLIYAGDSLDTFRQNISVFTEMNLK